MPKWINPELIAPVSAAMSASFDAVALADELAVCTDQPASFFEAVNPSAWVASTAYIIDATARPSVDRNGFTYVCTQAGTSGASEPVWPTMDGGTVMDGTAIWTARVCKCVANIAMTPSDFVKAANQLTIMPKTGITAHSAGQFAHIALIKKSENKLILVTPCAAQNIVAGNIVNTAAFHEQLIES